MIPSGFESSNFLLVEQNLSLMEKDCLVDLIVDGKLRDEHYNESVMWESGLHAFGSGWDRSDWLL